MCPSFSRITTKMELRMQEQELKEVEDDDNGNSSDDEPMDIDLIPTPDNLPSPPIPPPPPPTIDLSPFTSLLSQLDSTSGLKFLKVVVANLKQFCKLFTILPSSSPQAIQLFQKVTKICDKNHSDEKWDKFNRKLGPFSCEGEVFKTLLKFGMKSPSDQESGHFLISILTSLFKIPALQGAIISPITGIQMILSHSKAEDIFLEFHKLKVNRNKKLEQEEAIEKGKDFQQIKTAVVVDKLMYSKLKTELLKLWLVLVEGFTIISKTEGTPEDKKILENSVPYLMQVI